jgi:hypothetical protein
MRLHYDHYYTKGVTHKVCEDYAAQGDTPTPFIVLSDGCSSSPRSDIGAQILTLTTQQMIKQKWESPLDYLDFGQQLINTSWKVVENLQLPSHVLDATIMLAFLHEDNIMVYVYGDGCLLFKDHAGNLGTIEIAFTHNAPYFLTYWHDEERRHEYAKAEPDPLLIIDSVNGQSEPKPFNTQLVFAFPLKKFQVVAIASDGATHCVDTHQENRLSLYDVATHLLAFQNMTGEFVKRHTERALKDYAQQGIYPADDLSIGVFVQ